MLSIASENDSIIYGNIQIFDDSEVLKVASNDKGVLIPNVDIPNLNAGNPVNSPANSLLVYNTNVTSGKWNPFAIICVPNIISYFLFLKS